jgi:thiopeptide-type bacteriocin biosynthesis protein
MGNVICRPLLRRHDLPFLGHSGAPAAGQIALTDLWVSVEGSRIVLRSRRLGREIIPRLTNAHNFTNYGLGLYRFLGMMQHQHRMGISFQWGPLASSPFLPRVLHGRTVLALAHWNLEAATLAEWGEARGAQGFAAVQHFRHQERLPRWVCLRDSDNQLPIDLDNILSVETLVHLVKDRSRATLEELLPGPGQLCVDSPEGHYIHEVVIPFVRQAPAPQAERPALPAPPERTRPWRFPPGSEWLYVKLYAGVPTLDRLLQTTLAGALERLAASGAASRWFFLRYNDPDPHVRLRFHGEPRRLEAEVWPVLRDACAASLNAGEGWRLQLDTYEREVERYGGPAAIELAEELFTADSEAVLHLLRAYTGDAGGDMRWRLTLKGLDALLEDLGLSLDGKAAVAQRVRNAFGTEFHVNKPFEEQLSQRYRRESRVLEALLRASPQAESPWQPGLAAFHRRSQRLRPVAERLRRAEREGQLTVPVQQLAGSFLHMHVNRMLPSDQRAQELIIYDFLARQYRSQQARVKKT